jgi:hypothetical protein
LGKAEATYAVSFQGAGEIGADFFTSLALLFPGGCGGYFCGLGNNEGRFKSHIYNI